MQPESAERRMEETDVLVVGAGPAGAVAARGLSLEGARVLLVDKARFPRWKVCGCCLNGAALRTLDSIGLGGLPERLGAQRLTHVRITACGRTAEIALPDGVALSRWCFDEALIGQAVADGVSACTETSAERLEESGEHVRVLLRSQGYVSKVRARVVIGADGLAASFTRKVPGVRSMPARRARIGAGTSVDPAPQVYARNVIHMAVGAGGYVGLVRVEDDRLNVAAAFDVGFVRATGGLANAARCVLKESGLPAIEALGAARWRGTPPLTRRHQPLPHGRLYLVGDAAEYIEPFTGEGMAWALESGTAIVNYVMAALNGAGAATPAAWLRRANRLLGDRKRHCRWLASVLRRQRLTGLGVRLLHAYPNLATPYLRTLNRVGISRG
jgi:flavin-dependent dehydrogenase